MNSTAFAPTTCSSGVRFNGLVIRDLRDTRWERRSRSSENGAGASCPSIVIGSTGPSSIKLRYGKERQIWADSSFTISVSRDQLRENASEVLLRHREIDQEGPQRKGSARK